MVSENADQITLTDAAVAHVEQKLAERGKGVGVRIATKRTGCSGLQYVLEYVDKAQTGDEKFPVNEALAVYVDPKSFQYLKGSQLDYVKHGLNEGFEFVNPNEKGRCGCGESFQAND